MFQNAWKQIKSIQVIHIDHGEPRWSIRIIRIHLKPPAPGPCRLKQSGIPYSMTPWDMTQYAAGCRRSGNIREFLSRLPWDHILSMRQVVNIPQVPCTETIGWLSSAYCPKKGVAPVSVSCGYQSHSRWLSWSVILSLLIARSLHPQLGPAVKSLKEVWARLKSAKWKNKYIGQNAWRDV